MTIEDLKLRAVAALEDIKARNITVLDVGHLTSMTDCMIIASGDSNRQTRALAHHLRDTMRSAGVDIIGVEGEEAGEWVLVDLGGVVVHIMQPVIREYYNLEGLWGTEPPRARAA